MSGQGSGAGGGIIIRRNQSNVVNGQSLTDSEIQQLIDAIASANSDLADKLNSLFDGD